MKYEFELLLFISAISDYSQYNVLRKKIIDSLCASNYINLYEHEKENGGILLDVKSLKNPDQIYLKYQWSLIFCEKTCHIEHHFTIKATKFGTDIIVSKFSYIVNCIYFFLHLQLF